MCLFLSVYIISSSGDYLIDDRIGLGRTFDGVGGLSGGGVSLKLLINMSH